MKSVIVMLASLAMAAPAFAGDNINGNLSQSGSQAGASVNIQNGKSYRSTGAAIAPGLAVGAYSCQGSVSGGAGGAGWGFSFGSTVMDRDCNTRENAKVAGAAFGMNVARTVLCNIEQIRAAAPQCQPRRTVLGATRTSGYPKPMRRPVAVADNGWGQR